LYTEYEAIDKLVKEEIISTEVAVRQQEQITNRLVEVKGETH
jgi:hypothetical protein